MLLGSGGETLVSMWILHRQSVVYCIVSQPQILEGKRKPGPSENRQQLYKAAANMLPYDTFSVCLRGFSSSRQD